MSFFSGCEKYQTEIPDRAAKLAEKSIMLTSHVIYSRENFMRMKVFLVVGLLMSLLLCRNYNYKY